MLCIRDCIIIMGGLEVSFPLVLIITLVPCPDPALWVESGNKTRVQYLTSIA